MANNNGASAGAAAADPLLGELDAAMANGTPLVRRPAETAPLHGGAAPHIQVASGGGRWLSTLHRGATTPLEGVLASSHESLPHCRPSLAM